MVRDCSNHEVLSIFWPSAENARAKIVRQLAEIGNQISELEDSAYSSEDFAAQFRCLRERREDLRARYSLISPIPLTPRD